VSLNHYIATVLASRVGAQAEAERCFAARRRGWPPGRARDILARAGQGNAPRLDDELVGEEPPSVTAMGRSRPWVPTALSIERWAD
jgi:hypothetical protein